MLPNAVARLWRRARSRDRRSRSAWKTSDPLRPLQRIERFVGEAAPIDWECPNASHRAVTREDEGRARATVEARRGQLVDKPLHTLSCDLSTDTLSSADVLILAGEHCGHSSS